MQIKIFNLEDAQTGRGRTKYITSAEHGPKIIVNQSEAILSHVLEFQVKLLIGHAKLGELFLLRVPLKVVSHISQAMSVIQIY